MKKITLRCFLCAAILLLAIAISLPALAATTQVKATGTVNVRSGPGTNYSKLGQLNRDQVVNSTGTTGDWTIIEYGDGIGYVSSVYIAYVSGGAVSSNDSSTVLGTSQATGNVNVRSGPGTNYAKLGQLAKNTKVNFTGLSGGWYKIEYLDGVGYVSSTYMKTISTSGSSGSVSTTGQTMEAISNVNVRSGPGTNYSKLGQLKKGDKIEKKGSSSNWIMITYGSKTGYVRDDYLLPVISNITTNTNTNTTTTSTLLYALRATVVYANANTASSRIAYLNTGDSITYLADSGAWYKAQIGSSIGYVLAADMRKDNPSSSAMTAINEYRVTLNTSVPYYSTDSTAYQLGVLGKNISVYVQAANSTWAKCTYNNQTVYILVGNLSAGSDNMTTVNQYRTTIYSNVPYYASTTATSRLGSLAQGVSVYVQAANATWAKCTINNQSTVYIEVDYLSGDADNMTAVNEYRTTLSSNVPYYSSASTANYMGSLPINLSISVQAVNSTWARCTYVGQTVYIQVSNLSAGTGTDSSSYVAVNATMYTTSSVSYYATATTTGSALGTLGYDTAVYVQAQNSTWARCSYTGQTVYIQKAYLSSSSNSSGLTAVNPAVIMYARTQGVRCYMSPSTASGYVGSLSINELVQVTAKSTQWAECKIYDTATGTYIVRYVQLSDLYS